MLQKDAKHPSVAFVFKGLDSPFHVSRQCPALTSIWKHWQCNWPIEYNLCGNTDGFVFHSIASLVMAECAGASLIFTSFTDFPSLVCVEPKYVKWSTSLSVCPFICMLVHGLNLMLLTTILLLSELISMPYLAAVPTSIWMSCCNSSSLFPSRLMSSANYRLQTSRPLPWTNMLRLFCVFPDLRSLCFFF